MDGELGVGFVRDENRVGNLDFVLKNSFGMGGVNNSIIFSKFLDS